MSELPILQLFGRYGKINNIRYLWHIAGPLKGKPRGYCFLEFNRRDDAAEAIKALNNKPIQSYKLLVKWYEHNEPSTKETVNADVRKGTTDDKIRALEDKLREMNDPQASKIGEEGDARGDKTGSRMVGLMAMLDQSKKKDSNTRHDRPARSKPY